MPIHAPYNFVPLSDKIFFPEWASQITQDIPFSDGISGEIACSLTAQSPIYVRNSSTGTEPITDPLESGSQSFFKVGEEFIIPGSSLKGMIRSVIEIVSFGKLGRVDERKYSFRDLTPRHPYLSLMRGAKSGWLTFDESERIWKLAACEMARVDHNDLIRCDQRAAAIKGEQIAREKYAKWQQKLEISFDLGVKKPSGVMATNLGSSSAKKMGTLVFTGQPTANNGARGRKHLEFIFYDKERQGYVVSQERMREFKSIHADSEDWKFHEARKTVPVFFHGSSQNPTSIGLAMMYRLPYKYSTHDAIRNTSDKHFESQMDLAESLFGMDLKPEGLKGRVWFGQATATQATPGELVKTVLGSPKPTYYPSYIEQPSLQGTYEAYKTFQDKDCRLRGWKRYPARPFQAEEITVPDPTQDSVATQLIPLRQGAKFAFKIRVHNLKPIELGALLWSLEWGGKQNLCHSLGMGKALGFGQVKVSVVNTRFLSVNEAAVNNEELINSFTKQMDKVLGDLWINTPQMQQLLGMADPEKAMGKKLRHMTISGKEFVEGKKRKECLEPHIAISDPQTASGIVPVRQTTPPPISNQAAGSTECWKNVQLTFDFAKMEYGIAGKNAVTKHNPQNPLLSDRDLFLIKSNRKRLAHVTVRTSNGKIYQIVKIDLI